MTAPDQNEPPSSPPRLNRSNSIYDSLYDLKKEKEREVPRFAIWSNSSEKSAWLVSPIVMSAIAVVLLAVGIGYYFLRLPSPAETAAVLVEKREIPQLSSEEEVKAIHETVSGFVAANSLQERLAFVRHPKESMRRMEEFYGRVPVSQNRRVIDYIMIAKTDLPPRYHFFAAQALCSDDSRPIFTVMEEDDRYVIDWESSVGYNPMEWETFIGLQPQTPLDFRVHINPSDFYTGAFADSTVWNSVKLSYPGSDFVAYAWISANHNDVRRLSELMQSGMDRPVILKLSYTSPEAASEKPQLQILRLVNDTWLIP